MKDEEKEDAKTLKRQKLTHKDIVKHKEKNKEELQIKASVKFECPCGGKYTQRHKHEHMKKHLKYLGTFNEEEYNNSKRFEQLKQRYEKAKPNIGEEKMKEYKKKWYEKKKNQLNKD